MTTFVHYHLDHDHSSTPDSNSLSEQPAQTARTCRGCTDCKRRKQPNEDALCDSSSGPNDYVPDTLQA